MEDRPIKLLLVEDNPTDALILREALIRADLVLLDLGLPDASGMEALKGLLKICPDAPIVILTGLDDMELGLLAIQLGAEDYLPKSQLNAENLERIIRHSIARFQSRSERN